MKKKYWELNHPILRIIQHLAFWVLSFFVFLYLFKTGAKPEKIDYIYTILFQLTLLPAVYLNIELLLPKLGNKKRILFYLFSLVVLIILFAWINYSFFDDWSAKLFPDYFFISYFTYREIVLFFIVYTIITMLLKLSKSWFLVSELQKELLEKEKQKTEVELKALKAQINPHFFFNTLNSIYSMALDNDEQIAPLLLITFLENAFKHGAKGSSENTFIKLDIKVEKNKLNFTVENNKGYIDDVKTGDHNGLGLENVKRQLELLYPGKHLLNIKDEQDRFVVALQLSL